MRRIRCTISCCKFYKSRRPHINPKVTFHRFPLDKSLRRAWCHALKINEKKSCPIQNVLRVCSEHFTDDDYEPDFRAQLLNWNVRRKLKKGAVPSLNLVSDQKETKTKAVCIIEREKRQERKARKELVNQLIEEHNKQIQSNTEIVKEMIDKSESNIEIVKDMLDKYDKRKADSNTDEASENLSEEHQQEVSLNSEVLIVETPLCSSGDSLNSEVLIVETPLCSSADSSIPKSSGKIQQSKIEILEHQLARTQQELDKAMDRYRIKTQYLGSMINNLKLEIRDLKKQKPYLLQVDEEVTEILETFLTETQIQIVMNDTKNVNWTESELAKARKLSKMSKKAYTFLQKEMNYPLPDLELLDNYAKQKALQNNSNSNQVFVQNDHPVTKILPYEEYEIEIYP